MFWVPKAELKTIIEESERPKNAVLLLFTGRKEFVRESNWVFRSFFLLLFLFVVLKSVCILVLYARLELKLRQYMVLYAL